MTPKDNNCKVAVIGAGNMAKEHIKAFNDIEGTQVIGIYSRTRSKAESLADQFNIDFVCDSIRELYDKTKADIVVVTVSAISMLNISKIALDYPWTVLLEKPAGCNLEEAEEIYEISCEKHKYNVYVALNRRFYSSVQTSIKDLNKLPHNRLICIQDQEDQQAVLQCGLPKFIADNWMYINSIHLIDLFKVFGRGEVSSITPILHWTPKNPNFVVTKIDFSSGDIGIYTAIWNAPGPWSISISCKARRWELRPIEKATYLDAGTRIVNESVTHKFDIEFKPGLRLQAEHAVKAAAGKQNVMPTLSDSLETMRMVSRIYQ